MTVKSCRLTDSRTLSSEFKKYGLGKPCLAAWTVPWTYLLALLAKKKASAVQKVLTAPKEAWNQKDQREASPLKAAKSRRNRPKKRKSLSETNRNNSYFRILCEKSAWITQAINTAKDLVWADRNRAKKWRSKLRDTTGSLWTASDRKWKSWKRRSTRESSIDSRFNRSRSFRPNSPRWSKSIRSARDWGKNSWRLSTSSTKSCRNTSQPTRKSSMRTRPWKSKSTNTPAKSMLREPQSSSIPSLKSSCCQPKTLHTSDPVLKVAPSNST